MRFRSGRPAVMAFGAVVAIGMVAGFGGGAQASTRAEAGSQPGTVVSDLLVRVPQLAGDVPNASSISTPAGGKSASGGVSGAERGRLVPLRHPRASVDLEEHGAASGRDGERDLPRGAPQRERPLLREPRALGHQRPRQDGAVSREAAHGGACRGTGAKGKVQTKGV